ncbi:ATP-binding protein [Noviherbaspirillum denitrificans]|uniref:Histidine kinase/HSP90-like ATPase domain-containing protein n=1 Tax=Noviherbaspirillum denitrificans TaxID=1968433 RepID=A0A254T956_9BURK|nr:ATP-binding protein [Noviherbaspirillum denitrificans]OWW19179.1 hypothetical protein AYR66_06370 [Noviherbaspirillum denitrificans]
MEPTGNSFHGHSARFDACLNAVPVAVEFVHAALREAGVPPERIARCDLVVEELFRNSVLHGYGGDSGAPVWIGVENACIRYEDEAPAFDPLTAPLADDGAVRPIEEHRVGGVGLMLIRELPAQVEYRYLDGRNRLVIVP